MENQTNKKQKSKMTTMWVETTDFRFIHSRAVSHSSPLLQQHIKH